jgi:hypothetical protein
MISATKQAVINQLKGLLAMKPVKKEGKEPRIVYRAA